MPSGGTNWGPTDERMQDSVRARTERFIAQNHLPIGTSVPKEMLFASASGVDPHISPEAARLQIDRIASVRGFDPEQRSLLIKLVDENTMGPQMQLFGEPRVNVLKLNIALDEL
jgi:K+-transporting ATPase ATPase C chain